MMLNRTTPKRLTLIVLALVLGILLGLALFPSGDLSGAAQVGICDSVTEIPLADCQALEALYNSTNGPAWTESTDWLVTSTPCDWFGIRCVGGRVGQIMLPGNGLNGSLPPAVGDLGGLEILLLGNNQLTGPIPAELGKLTSLEILLLGENQLTGPIPAELGKLTSLTRLNLSTNQLSGEIPTAIGSLTNLRDVSLAYNNLEGPIPTEIGQIGGLQIVEMVSNTLEGPLPSTMGSLNQLEWLDLSENAITGTIPAEWGGANNLGSLFVRSNQLEGSVPATLCDSLQEGTLAYNMFDPLATDPCIDDAVESNWKQTQTLPPADLVAQSPAPGEVDLSWTPVTALANQGFYEILYATTSGGPYAVHGSTDNKQTSAYNVTGLDPNQELYFVVRTVTPAHGQNQSELVSPNSQEAPITPTAVTLTSFTASAVDPSSLWLLSLAMALTAVLTLILLRHKSR